MTLTGFLGRCHDLSIRAITDKTLTTRGNTTTPAHRHFPHQILRWHHFPDRQSSIWSRRRCNSTFRTNAFFPSSVQLDYVKRQIDPIESEQGLRYSERDTVEKMVMTMIEDARNDVVVCERLQLADTITFESHDNFGQDDDES